MSTGVDCPACGAVLELEPGQEAACPVCGARQLSWFGAGYGRGPAARAGARAVEGDATCYFHASRRAETACEACGRFVCALCDLPVGGHHLCPACVEEGRSPQVRALQAPSVVRWDRIVFSVTLLGSLLLWFVSFLTAPVLLYLALRHGRATVAALPAGRLAARLRLWTAVLINVAALGVWLWIASLFILSLTR